MQVEICDMLLDDIINKLGFPKLGDEFATSIIYLYF